MLIARVSAEISALTDLGEVCRWLIERQYNPLRLHAGHLPALVKNSSAEGGTSGHGAAGGAVHDLAARPGSRAACCLLAGILRFRGPPDSGSASG